MAEGGSGDKADSEKELAEAVRLLAENNPGMAEIHAKKALIADKTSERAYICAAKSAFKLGAEDRAEKYLQLGRSRCPNSKEIQIMFEGIMQIKKQLLNSLLSPPEPKQTKHNVVHQPVPPKSAKEMMFANLREGSEALEIHHFKIAIECYKKALEFSKECKREEKPERARKYALSMAYIGLGNYESLVSAAELLKPLKGRTFPTAYYGMALVFEKFNRYKLLLEETNEGQQLLMRLCNDPDRFCWPGRTNLIEETQKNVLIMKLKELQEKYTIVPKPDAVCRLPECLQLSSHIYPSDAIFHTDPDFAGYFITICEEKCRIAFHVSCWKHLKEKMSDSVKISDKDMLGTKCLTDGCRTGYYKPRDSIIIRIIVIDANNIVKAEMERERSEDPVPPPPPKPVAVQKKPRKRPDRPFVPKPPVPAKAALQTSKKTKRHGPHKKDLDDGDDGHDPAADLQAAIASLDVYRETNFNRNMNRVYDPRYEFYSNEGIKMMEYFVPDRVDDSPLEKEKKQFYRMYHNYLETVGSSARWQLTKFMKERGYCQLPNYFIEENGTAAFHLVKSPMFACIDDKYCLAESVNLMYRQVKNELVTNMQKILGNTTNSTQQDVSLAAPKVNPTPTQTKTSPSSSAQSVQSSYTNKAVVSCQQSEKEKTIVNLSNIEATKKNNTDRSAPLLLDLQYKPINFPSSIGTRNNVSFAVKQSDSLSPDNSLKVNDDSSGLNVKGVLIQEESGNFKNPFLDELDRKSQGGSFFGEDSDSSTDEVIVPHKEKDLDLFAGLEAMPNQVEQRVEENTDLEGKTDATENIVARNEKLSMSSDSTSFSSAQDGTLIPDLQSDLNIHEKSTETLSQSEEDSSPNAHKHRKRRRSSKSDIPATPNLSSAETESNSNNTVASVKDEETDTAAAETTADDDNSADSELKLKYRAALDESKLALKQLLDARRNEVKMQLKLNAQHLQLTKVQNENDVLRKRIEQQELQLQQMKAEKAREMELHEKSKKALETTRGLLLASQEENVNLKSIKTLLESSTAQLEPQLVNTQRRLVDMLLNYWNYVMKHYRDLSLNNLDHMYSSVKYLSAQSNPSVQDLYVATKEWDDMMGVMNDLNIKFTEKMGPFRAFLRNGKPADKKLLSIDIPKLPEMPTDLIGELLKKDLHTKGSIFGVKSTASTCSVATQTKSKKLEILPEQSSSLLRSASTSNVTYNGATFYTNGHKNSPLTVGNPLTTSMSSNALDLSLQAAPAAARSTLVPTPPMSRPYVPIPMPGDVARPMSPQVSSFARPTTPLGPIARPSSSQVNTTVNSFAPTRPVAPPSAAQAASSSSTTMRQPSAATTGITVTLPKPVTNGTPKPVSMAAALKGTKPVNGVATRIKPTGTKRTSYDILVKDLSETHPFSSKDDLRQALVMVRERNNNKLTGLTKEEIARRVADILVEFLIERPLPDSENDNAKILYTADGQADECVICLQAKREGNVFALSCKHGFHPKCIRRWLQQERHCPVCRFNVLQSTRYNDVEFPPLRN